MHLCERARRGLQRVNVAGGPDDGGRDRRVVAGVRTDVDENIAGLEILLDGRADVPFPRPVVARERVLRDQEGRRSSKFRRRLTR